MNVLFMLLAFVPEFLSTILTALMSLFGGGAA